MYGFRRWPDRMECFNAFCKAVLPDPDDEQQWFAFGLLTTGFDAGKYDMIIDYRMEVSQAWYGQGQMPPGSCLKFAIVIVRNGIVPTAPMLLQTSGIEYFFDDTIRESDVLLADCVNNYSMDPFIDRSCHVMEMHDKIGCYM